MGAVHSGGHTAMQESQVMFRNRWLLQFVDQAYELEWTAKMLMHDKYIVSIITTLTVLSYLFDKRQVDIVVALTEGRLNPIWVDSVF